MDYVKNLRRTLGQHADLTQYTTSIAMDDLDDVRAWLGYDRINFFGLSYGTRAVLVYLRQHPDHVHTATLIGVAPTYLKMPLISFGGGRARDGSVAWRVRKGSQLSHRVSTDSRRLAERAGATGKRTGTR